jgi:hypothetical protein
VKYPRLRRGNSPIPDRDLKEDDGHVLGTRASSGRYRVDEVICVLDVLTRTKNGSFIVIEADATFTPPKLESRDVFGMQMVQDRNAYQVTVDDLADVVCGALTPEATRDLLLGLVAIKYTQSNSVRYVLGGEMIGISAGQQSRVDCTTPAGHKADVWWLTSHPKVLDLRFKSDVTKQIPSIGVSAISKATSLHVKRGSCTRCSTRHLRCLRRREKRVGPAAEWRVAGERRVHSVPQ